MAKIGKLEYNWLGATAAVIFLAIVYYIVGIYKCGGGMLGCTLWLFYLGLPWSLVFSIFTPERAMLYILSAIFIFVNTIIFFVIFNKLGKYIIK